MQQLVRRFLAFAAMAAAVGCSSGKTGAASSGDPCAKVVEPANDGFCHQDNCQPALQCGAAQQRPVDCCCVLVGMPGEGKKKPQQLVRTTDTKKYAGTGSPDLSCFDPAHYPPKPPSGTPKLVTMKGLVQAFAHGCDMAGVKVEIYKVKRTGDPATDGDLGALVGQPFITTQSSAVTLTANPNCPDDRKDRAYSYANVPMYTELVVKTSDADPASGTWAPLIMYNIYITNTDPDYKNGVYTFNLDALASDDFNLIPTVAINRPMTPGNGAIGGEIHDCGNVRLQYARVDVSTKRESLVYFDASEENPLPDTNRSAIGTGRTALYAALDIKPGFARVAATGYMPDGKGGSKLVSLGYYDVRVFPNSVTSVSLRGLRPYQEPK